MGNTEPASETDGGGNYLGLSLIRAPKKNHKSIEQIGKAIVQWFEKHGARPIPVRVSSEHGKRRKDAFYQR